MNYYLFTPLYPDDSLSVTGKSLNRNKYRSCDARQCKLLDVSYLSNYDFIVNQHGREYDLLANNMGWYIVVSYIKSALQCICEPSEIQFLPFTVFESIFYSRYNNSYDLMNILSKIDCIDFEKSSLGYDYNDIGIKYISSVYKLRLKTSEIQRQSNIFRLKSLETYTIVSERFVNTISEFMPIACSFTLLE